MSPIEPPLPRYGRLAPRRPNGNSSRAGRRR